MATRTEQKDTTPDLAAEVAELRKEVETVLTHLRKIGTEGVQAAGAEARARAARGGAKAEKLAADAREEWHGLEDKLATELRERPMRTLGFAALGGLVLGLILRR